MAVRDAAQHADGATVARFTGWGQCKRPNDAGIRVTAFDNSSNASGQAHVGRFERATDRVEIELDPWNKSQSQIIGQCWSRPLDCVRTFALHEFGHALGLRHEQDNDTSAERCTLAAFYGRADGDLYGLPYDPDLL